METMTHETNSPHIPRAIKAVCFMCNVWYWTVASTDDYQMVGTKRKYKDSTYFRGDPCYYYMGTIEEEEHKKA